MHSDEHYNQVVEVFGKHLASVRKSEGMSQERLSSLAGVSESTVPRIERGELNPTLKTLHKLADALGMDIKQLLP